MRWRILISGPLLAVLFAASPAALKSESQGAQTDPASEPSQALLPAPAIDFTRCGTVSTWPTAPITLEWASVAGSAGYSVEVDCYGCRNQPRFPPQPWFSQSGTPWLVQHGLDLFYVTDVVSTLRVQGGRNMRWRVWAVDANGREGQRTDWCGLAFSDSGKPTPGAPTP